MRTSLQEKEKNKRGATTTANARADPTSQSKTSEKTPTSAITRRTHHLDLLQEFRPSSTSPSTPGPRVLSLDPSDLHPISLEKSTEGGHRSPLGGIAIHRPPRRRTCLHPRLDLIRNIHHPRRTPRDSNQQQKLNYNGYPFEQLDATSQEPGGK